MLNAKCLILNVKYISNSVLSLSIKHLALSIILVGCGLFELPESGRRRPADAPATGRPTPGVGAVTSDKMQPRRFNDLPGWKDDDHRYALQAFRHSCSTRLRPSGRIQPDPQAWESVCAALPKHSPSVREAREWFERHFQPFEIVDGTPGRHTGYFSPVVPACRVQTDECRVPIMERPTDGRQYVGVDSVRIVNERIGNILYWIHPIDLQDKGSSTIVLEDGTRVQLSTQTTNQLPFNGIGAQLLARGIRPDCGMGMRCVREFLKRPENRELADELVANNPRYVFYTHQATQHVVGRMGVPLSRIRSIAVDENIYTMGMPFWLDTTLAKNNQPFRRLMIGQDTGGAILGYNRTDIYFGSGDIAFNYAQGQNTTGRLFLLMPRVAR